MSTSIATLHQARVRDPIGHISRAALSAGMTVLLVYLFAGLTIQVGVLTQLGLSANEPSNWFFITWMTTGLFSLALALFTRQPVSINLSIPALVFLAGAAGGFSFPQILGANLVVGVATSDARGRAPPAMLAARQSSGGTGMSPWTRMGYNLPMALALDGVARRCLIARERLDVPIRYHDVWRPLVRGLPASEAVFRVA